MKADKTTFKIQLVKFGIGIIVGVTSYLLIKLIF